MGVLAAAGCASWTAYLALRGREGSTGEESPLKPRRSAGRETIKADEYR
jgi:hypothetical protein